ncbi:hypothetical protein FBUS_07812 [Fasciolopsis buskii]|uniref:Uncharacterized protein n=1 Tax=Fasciolopsis buskii TaxID=27845 RepID=A0A8E0VQ90_9TREM|nr:hypothetical protein FBUS_07812 [Fasciolopsis buski]
MKKLGNFFSSLRVRRGKRNAQKAETEANEVQVAQIERSSPTEVKMGDIDGNTYQRTEVTNQCGEGTTIEPASEMKDDEHVVTGDVQLNIELHKDGSAERSEECEPTVVLTSREPTNQPLIEEESSSN